MSLRCVILVCAISFPLSAARSEDLVVNGGFDENVASWVNSQAFLEVGWGPSDVKGSPLSGSALVTSTDSRTGVTVGMTQCMNLSSTDFHDFTGWIYRPSGQSEEARVGFLLDWRTDVCGSGIRIRITYLEHASSTDTWELIEGSVEPPVDAFSVLIHAYILFSAKNESGGAYQTYFDNIKFVPEPSLSTQSFVAALTLVALATGVGVKRSVKLI